MSDNIYKILQVSSVLIEKYGYAQVLLEEYREYAKNEAWLTNFDDDNYPLIRITLNPASMYTYDRERVSTYLNYFEQTFRIPIRFLDIHISEDEYDASLEEHDHLNLSIGHASGADVSGIYPDIYTALKETDDPGKETMQAMHKIRQAIDERRKKLAGVRRRPIVSLILICLCCIVYLASLFLSSRYSITSVYVALGANYPTFTVGLKQYFRLFSCAFIHGGYLHLISNLYSLYTLGTYLEDRYGSGHFAMLMFCSIIAGSLCQTILSENTIMVGISGGLYGAMAVFIIDLIKNRHASLQTFLPLIVINLGINFISTTAWLAHLGGAVCGYLFFMIFDNKDNKGYIALLALMMIILFVKTLSIRQIGPFYPGTDQEVLQIYNDLGLKSYAQMLLGRLLKVYTTFGG